MKSLWLVLLFTCSAAVFLPETVGCGFGYELIIERLESMQTELKQLMEDQRQFKLSTNNASAQQSKLMEDIIDHAKNSASKIATMEAKVNQLMEDQRLFNASAQQSKLMEKILDHSRTSASKTDRLLEDQRLFKLKTEEILDQTRNSALRIMLLSNQYFEMDWTVIQRRISGGRLSFNRTWAEYRDGFGNVESDYWMGLEKMHQLTRQDTFELLVVLKNFAGVEKRAKYGRFRIASEDEQYRLDVEKFIEGDAEDSLQIHNGNKFSTPDRDNDTSETVHCAKKYFSGWWFHSWWFHSWLFIGCFQANLNGVNTEGEYGLVWHSFNNSWENLKEARMMIRRAGSNVP